MRESPVRLAGFVLWLLLLSVPSRADVLTIDFEGLAEFDSVAAAFPGLTFSNALVLSAGTSLNEFEFPPASGMNVIIDDGGPVRVDFATLIDGFGGFFTYLAPLTLSAFDMGGTLLGSVSSLFGSNLAMSGDSGSAPNEFLELLIPGISFITITADPLGYSFAADDLTITRDTPPAPVPEPGTFSLFLLVGAGAAVRHLARHRRSGSTGSAI